MFSVCVCVFLYLCTGRGFATNWSPVQGVLPTVPDQETEETQPYAPKAGASSQVWEQRGRKKFSPKNVKSLFPYLSGHAQTLHVSCVVRFQPALSSSGKRRLVTYYAICVFLPSPFDSAGRLSLNLVCTLCHWMPTRAKTFQLLIISNNKIVDAQTCEVRGALVLLHIRSW
jgi:hypothetical protein